MDNDLNFVPIKCPSCNGYGAFGREPNRKICPACGGLGALVVDQMTGKIVERKVDDGVETTDTD